MRLLRRAIIVACLLATAALLTRAQPAASEVVVAQDGRGDYTTIEAAIDGALGKGLE